MTEVRPPPTAACPVCPAEPMGGGLEPHRTSRSNFVGGIRRIHDPRCPLAPRSDIGTGRLLVLIVSNHIWLHDLAATSAAAAAVGRISSAPPSNRSFSGLAVPFAAQTRYLSTSTTISTPSSVLTRLVWFMPPPSISLLLAFAVPRLPSPSAETLEGHAFSRRWRTNPSASTSSVATFAAIPGRPSSWLYSSGLDLYALN